MSAKTLKRLSGISLLAGCVILLISIIPALFRSDTNDVLGLIMPVVSMFGAMLMALGLPGVYARISERVGILGLLGFILTFFWLLITLAFEPIVAFVLPFLSYLSSKAPNLTNVDLPAGLFFLSLAGNLLFLVGGTLLGIAILRSALAAKLAGAVLAVGALISFVGNFLPQFLSNAGTIIFLVGLIWLTINVALRPTATALEEDAELSSAGARA